MKTIYIKAPIDVAIGDCPHIYIPCLSPQHPSFSAQIGGYGDLTQVSVGHR
jgi:hypothetical protein